MKQFLKDVLAPSRHTFIVAALVVLLRFLFTFITSALSYFLPSFTQGAYFISNLFSWPFLPAKLLNYAIQSSVFSPSGEKFITSDLIYLIGMLVISLFYIFSLYALAGLVVYFYKNQKKPFLYGALVLFIILPILCQLFFAILLQAKPSVDDPAKPLIAEVPRTLIEQYDILNLSVKDTTLSVFKCNETFSTKYAISTTSSPSNSSFLYDKQGERIYWFNYKETNICSPVDMENLIRPAKIIIPENVTNEFQSVTSETETTLSFCVNGRNSIFSINRSSGFSSVSKIFSANGLLLNKDSGDDTGASSSSWGLSTYTYRCEVLQRKSVLTPTPNVRL